MVIENVLQDTGFPGGCLELEVTESVIQNVDDGLAIFDGIQAMGIRIAIDDFGTGYSSLASLKQLPINCLKIDRLFIQDMSDDPRSSLLIGTIINLAHSLGYRVVAEGAETLDQVKILHGIGCDVIQGYYFSKPVSADLIPDLVRQNFLSAKPRLVAANTKNR